jgi:predicted ATP-grasp superfamily ATP-dependent carboligase
MKTRAWEERKGAKVYRASNPEEFLASYDQCSKWTDLLLAQEWIEGSDAALYSCNCYFNADAKLIATFVARKLRQWPPEAGTSCLGEECRNDVVLEETLRLFGGVRYCGLGYVEMKRDERTGKHFFIEANVGRPTGRSAIAEAGGVELLYAMYCDAVGYPLPAVDSSAERPPVGSLLLAAGTAYPEPVVAVLAWPKGLCLILLD